jgi:hypothetical protein
MRREDFIIEGIPSGYQVREVDLTPSGRPVCVLTHKTDFQAEALLHFTDSIRPIPEDAVFRVTSTAYVSPPLVRCMGDDRALLHGSAERADDINARILDHSGRVEHSFNIGGPSEVLANEHWIVTHYNDQAMTSDDYPVDREGLAVFDAGGTLLWGFQSQFAGNPRLDVFFHAAGWVGPDEVGVYRDIERKLSTLEGFMRLNIRDRSHEVWQVPREAHFSTALTVLNDRVIFHGFSGGSSILGMPPSPSRIVRWLMVRAGRANSLPKEGDVVDWKVGSDTCRVVGRYPGRGTLRGLPGGRFIAANPDGYTILSVD